MSGPVGVLLHCPYCGRALPHLHSEGDWHFYHCWSCGPMTLPSDGRIRLGKATDYQACKADDGKHGT